MGIFKNIAGPSILTFSKPHSDAMYLSYSSSPLVNNRYQGEFCSTLALNSSSDLVFFFDDEELAFLFAGFLDGKEGDSFAALFVVVVSDRRVVTMLDTNVVQWALDRRDVDETKSTSRKNFMPIDAPTANKIACFLLHAQQQSGCGCGCRKEILPVDDGNSKKDRWKLQKRSSPGQIKISSRISRKTRRKLLWSGFFSLFASCRTRSLVGGC